MCWEANTPIAPSRCPGGWARPGPGGSAGGCWSPPARGAWAEAGAPPGGGGVPGWLPKASRALKENNLHAACVTSQSPELSSMSRETQTSRFKPKWVLRAQFLPEFGPGPKANRGKSPGGSPSRCRRAGAAGPGSARRGPGPVPVPPPPRAGGSGVRGERSGKEPRSGGERGLNGTRSGIRLNEETAFY